MKIGGGDFATPDDRKLIALRAWISQQVEIAALHQLQARARQANGPVAHVVCLPAGTCRNARAAEQRRRNNPIGFASKAAVERAQRKPKSLTSLPRQPISRMAARSAGGGAPQAQPGIGARGEVRIERDDDRRWRRGVRAADEHDWQTTMAVVDEPIVAVIGAALECRRR